MGKLPLIKFPLFAILTIFSISSISCNSNPLNQNGTGNSVEKVTQSSLRAPQLPKPDHTVIVVLENHAESKIIGSATAPYINTMANSGALFTQSFGLTHPSQPNYLMLFSGEDQGVTNDNIPVNLPFTTPNLASALLSKGLSFTGFSENLPSVGFNGPTSGSYARKHSPWTNWQGSGNNNLSPELNQPFSSFPANYNTLPTVSYVIPNLNDDMHNGTINASDAWLKNNMDGYVQWANKNNSLLIITFDEDDRLHKNQITTIFSGPMVKPGQYNEQINHYNVLRTIEDMYVLPYAGNSSGVSPISDCWTNLNKLIKN